MHTLKKIVAISLFSIAMPAVAVAADKAPADVASADGATNAAADGGAPKKPADPMVCERMQEMGSLLRKKKVCMLKSQWDEQRRGDRADIERSQVQHGLDPVG